MAKGAQSKEQIINQILTTFPGAFKYDKELRIPMMEDSEEIQIKISLTCAKVNVERGDDAAIPGQAVSGTVTKTEASNIGSFGEVLTAPTEEEKKNVTDLLSKLGLA